MRTFEVRRESTGIDFAPDGIEEINQNLRTILGTMVGSVPLDREFGFDASMLDEPQELVQARMTGEIITAIHTYEHRVQVIEVVYEDGEQLGQLIPIVRYGLVEEGEGE
ncbi:GPW/gp25 family protein [Paenibacillus sp. 481]|uniref:GPW/gp25 family protein n=1 Tax=Paenibacillus sp. 481 TaxID=2835869 RepID=UPI001E4CA6C7|nr:GPW/gp25 family protein [Paenibacillus sp. 481]UHA74455.1 GPW/gp25 family protein [Paenibacillus sp. 481]